MKKILIIGGCGYIGSSLFTYLNGKYNVESVDLEIFGNPNIKNFRINFKDLSKEYLSQFTDIVLLAGHSSVKMCEDNMLGAFKNNVEYFIELLLKINPNQKFIYASSSSVYGNVNRNVVTEECQEYVAGSFYDLSKAEIDYYAKIFDNVEYYGLRFGTVNGFSRNIRNDIMINSMVNSAITKGEIRVFNPMIKRPILYIGDLCRAIEKIILNERDLRGVYNLASFNSTVDIIGRKVAEVFEDVKLSIIDGEPTKEENINKKLHSKVYDFAISSDKFITNFDFEFEGTITKIAKELKDKAHEAVIINNRNVKDVIV
jgi:nucleoside-diphosphate-sugar epimerase